MKKIKNISLIYRDKFGAILKIICVLFLCCSGVPVIYVPSPSELDPSWMFGLNYADIMNYKFGTDSFFTYGPLGFFWFLFPLYNNNIIVLHLLWNISWILLLGAILSYMFFSKDMAYYNTRNFHIVMFTLLSFWGVDFPDVFYLFIEILLISLSIYASKRLFWFFLACMVAVIFLYAKFTLGIISVVSLALAVAYFAYHKENIHNEFLLCFVGIPLAFLLTYMTYNPSLDGLINYIVAGIKVSSEYCSAMSLPVSARSWKQIFCIFIFIGYLVYMAWKKHELPFLSVFLFAFFIGWKHGAGRGDSGHMMLFFKYTFTYIGIFLYFLRYTINFSIIKRHKRIVGLLSLCLLVVIWPYRSTVMPWQIIETRFYYYQQSWQLLRGNIPADGRTLKLNESFLTQIGSNRFTVYPWELSYGLGHDNFEMMPMFQAYLAYTPYLDKLDAMYFFEKRPPFIVFNLDTIDNRYPLIENPQTWLKIYENYEIADYDGHNFLLKAGESKVFNRGEAVNMTVNKWNEIILPETDGHILLSLKADLSLWGKIKKFLYKVPEVNMTAVFEDGRTVNKRVLLENMSGETLIDFLPLKNSDIYEMFMKEGGYPKVKKISFSGNGLNEYAEEMELSFIPINIVGDSKTKDTENFFNSPVNLSVSTFEAGMGNVDSVNGGRLSDGIRLMDDFIEIQGWLVDELGKKACKNVFIVCDGKAYSTYKVARSDVKDVYGEDALYSGFTAMLDRVCFTEGKHKIELWGEAENGHFIRFEFGDIEFKY